MTKKLQHDAIPPLLAQRACHRALRWPRCVDYTVIVLATAFAAVLAAQELPPTPPNDLSGHLRGADGHPPREAMDAIVAFQLAPGMEASLYAAEPRVANPVALTFDRHGRCLVCESFRQEQGVEDNRQHMDWLDDDLAAQTVEDRLRMYEKYLGDGIKNLTEHADQIRMLFDDDQDGQADRSTVFAGPFHDALEGTGAGILAIDDLVYYTCIPRLWAFRDADGDGRADQETVLLDGFGVRVAFRGHDLHGLCHGPDGRLYFSIGDRGYHVQTEQGLVADPESGAVFRCELDGSHLEVYATGFRNPQELAFDDLGNLFTGDNNSDGLDLARWVHILPGMDAGWRMAFQYLPDRGPWNQERMWEPYHAGQPAFLYPPVANLSDGPSGLAYYPGTGLPDAYLGNFFLCDFRGTTAISGLRTFKVQPSGATFQLIDPELFVWNCLVTDVAFGPRGGLYITDWVEGWTGVSKGRIYHVFDPMLRDSDVVKEVDQVLADDMSDWKVADVMKLLEHPDQRVRHQAQMDLARRQAVRAFSSVADDSPLRVARMHAVWGLGQIARRGNDDQRASAREKLRSFADDVDFEVRAATLRALADCNDTESAPLVVRGLADREAKVRAEAAFAAGALRLTSTVPQLVRMAQRNDGTDPALRHAAVMGLAGTATDAELESLSEHPSEEVRLVAVVALRRQQSPRVATYLRDEHEHVATEAALAIHDQPIPAAYSALAEFGRFRQSGIPMLRRALNANYRLGTKESANALAEFANDSTRPLLLRQMALSMLATWDSPSPRDRVLGMWRPITTPRDPQDAVAAFRRVLPELLESGHELRYQAARMAAQFELPEAIGILRQLLADRDRSGAERAGALLALSAMKPDDLETIATDALTDPEERLRAAARILMTQINSSAAVPLLNAAVREGTPLEQQSALESLARVALPEADEILEKLFREFLDDPTQFQATGLELVNAVRQRSTEHGKLNELLEEYTRDLPSDDPLAPFHVTLHGGNAERGERIFFDRIDVACIRCHAVDGQGGRVGPDLTHIAANYTREQLLESLIVPSASIAKGFDNLIVVTSDGKVVSGIQQEKSETQLVLMDPQGELLTLDLAEIEEVQPGQSAMPADVAQYLTLQELRDLVEYLAEQK